MLSDQACRLRVDQMVAHIKEEAKADENEIVQVAKQKQENENRKHYAKLKDNLENRMTKLCEDEDVRIRT